MASYRGANVWQTLGQGLQGIGRNIAGRREQAAALARQEAADARAEEDRRLKMAVATFDMDQQLRERGGQLDPVTSLLGANPRYGSSPNAGMPDDIGAALRQSEGPSLFERKKELFPGPEWEPPFEPPEPGLERSPANGHWSVRGTDDFYGYGVPDPLPEYRATAAPSPFDLPEPNVLQDVDTVHSGGRTYRGLDTPFGAGYAEDPETRASRLAQEEAARKAAVQAQRRTDLLGIPGADPARVDAELLGVDYDSLRPPAPEMKTERVNENGRWVVYKINPDGTRTRLQDMGAAGRPPASSTATTPRPETGAGSEWARAQEGIQELTLLSRRTGALPTGEDWNRVARLQQFQSGQAMAEAYRKGGVQAGAPAPTQPPSDFSGMRFGGNGLAPTTAPATEPEPSLFDSVATPKVAPPTGTPGGAMLRAPAPSAMETVTTALGTNPTAITDAQALALRRQLEGVPRDTAVAWLREDGADDATIKRILGGP